MRALCEPEEPDLVHLHTPGGHRGGQTRRQNEPAHQVEPGDPEATSNLAALRQTFSRKITRYQDLKPGSGRSRRSATNWRSSETAQAAAAPAAPTPRKVTNPQMQKSLQDVQAQTSANQVESRRLPWILKKRTGRDGRGISRSRLSSPASK